MAYMNRYVRVAVHRLPYLGVILFLVASAPRESPLPRLSHLLALALGMTAGTALFAVLARRLRPPPVATPHVARAMGILTPRLLIGALVEETFWRYLVLCSLIATIGLTGAVLVTTISFALAHIHYGLRRARVHLVTGATFTCVYLGSGHLVAAVAAHLTYNLLVVAATTGWTSAPAVAEGAR
jgi:membrane protease YdiL (CAAX protease family)